MILLTLALSVAAALPERCEIVRRDHEQFRAWAFAGLKQFQSTKAPSAAERRRWAEFERQMEARINEFNRRYENCREG